MDFRTWIATLGGESHLYANASNAYKDFLAFLRAVRKTTRGNVVIPTYLPAKLWRASLAAGCEVRFYDVGGACEPDLDQLDSLVDHDTVTILAVHYFGFPTRIDEIAEIARRRGTVLIEDCALTLDGKHRGRQLGTIGDAAIFSMRKMFLYSEGGVLRIGDRFSDFWPRYQHRVASAWSVQHFLMQRAKRLYVRATQGADPLRVFGFGFGVEGYMDWSAPQRLTVKRLSRFTERRLRWSDVERAVERRRRAYRIIAQHLPETPRFEPLHRELPDAVTPSGFPLLVTDGTRDEVRRFLLERGVRANAGWPESPFDPSHHRARKLATQLLELPVHQALTDAQIDRMLRAMEELAGGRRPAGVVVTPAPQRADEPAAARAARSAA